MAAGGLRPLAQQGEDLLLHLLCNGQARVGKAGHGVDGGEDAGRLRDSDPDGSHRDLATSPDAGLQVLFFCTNALCTFFMWFCIIETFVIILLHRFHWAQVLQRCFAEAGMGPLAKRSLTFKSFFHACLGLCMLRETDLEGAIEELRNMEMEDEILEQAKDQFLK